MASLGAFVAVVAGLTPGGTASASAHVTSEEQPAATQGGRTPVSFTFDHGCNGQPTTSLRVQVPAGVVDVVPENPAGWTSTVVGDELRWEGGSIPDRERASFVAVMTLTQPEGTVVHFPAIQGCPTAETAWIELPDATNPEPRYPAPRIVVGAPADAAIAAEPTDVDHAGAAAAPTADGPTTTRVPLQQTPITSEGSDQSSAGQVVFLVVVAVIAGGAVILFLKYRRRS